MERTVHAVASGLDVAAGSLPVQCSIGSQLPAPHDQLPTARKGVQRCSERFQADGDHAGGQATGGQHAGQPGQELIQEEARVVDAARKLLAF